MFVRHHSLRRSSLVMKLNAFDRFEWVEDTTEKISDDEPPLDKVEEKAVDKKEIVTITIGKTIFKTYASSILNLPKTKLYDMYVRYHRGYMFNLKHECTMHFDRDPKLFSHILDAYDRKSIHVPREVCVRQFNQELDYWKMKHVPVARCCRESFMEAFEDIYQLDMIQTNLSKMSIDMRTSVILQTNPSMKEYIWEFLEDYQSSNAAKWFSWLYNIMIVASVAVTFFTTHPRWRVQLPEYSTHYRNQTTSYSTQLSANVLTNMLLQSQPHWLINIIEVFCAAFMTVLLVLKAITCSSKKLYFLSLTFWSNLLYVLPVWLLYGVSSIDETFWAKPNMVSIFQVVQVVSIFRFVRLYMLEKSYQPFRILKLAVVASVNELFMLFMFITLAVILYGSFIYSSELLATETFGDTFTGMWCGLITMLTVGYGEVSPTHWVGKIVAAFCAITGIIMVGMPLPIISNSFHGYYDYVYNSGHCEKISKGKVNPSNKVSALKSDTRQL